MRESHSSPGVLPIAALLHAIGFFPNVGLAQVTSDITADGTLGTAVSRTDNVFDIDGGTISGTNQFHSFDRFSVGTGDIASFNGPTSVENILSRVTGGVGSEIDGTVRSTIAGANLFLLNPSGVMFGPNASLEVQGAFHASTADYIGLDDGTRFSATSPADGALLTTAAPSAFGFLNAAPASLDVATPNVLQVAAGETLSFVGGKVTLGAPDGGAPAYVLAPGGRLNLISAASAGEAAFDGRGFNVDAFPALGEVRMQGGSVADAKEVFIRGGRFVIDESVILPGAFSLFGLGPPPDGGEVNIKVTGDMTVTGTAPEPVTAAPPGILTFSGAFDAIAPPAAVPDITIEAGSVSLSGFATVQTDRFGPGDPPNVTVSADVVEVADGAAIAVFNFFEGTGGQLTVDGQRVELSGDGTQAAAGATGLLAQGLLHPIYGSSSIDPALTFADSATITVNAADRLTVRGGAQITTDSRSFGASDDIDINAAEMFLSGRGGLISAQSAFAGDAGNVTLTADGAGRITIDDGFLIAANTFGSGDSGGVDVTAAGSIAISGRASGIASQTVPPPEAELNAFATVILGPGASFPDLAAALGLDPTSADVFEVLDALNAFGLTTVADLSPGDGGNITLRTPLVTVSGRDSAIDSSTAWDGNAGEVSLDVNALSVRDGAQIRSRSGLVNLVSGNLFVGTGNAGRVVVDATDTISVTGADSAISTSAFGDGDGGAIDLSAGLLEVLDGAEISADSAGTGLTGNITITTGDEIRLTDGTISTRALTSDGGNIVANTENVLRLVDSEITTSVESGTGGGGNINIDPELVVLQGSKVIANAFGGNGGNISIVAGQFIATPDSVVEASSTQRIDGNVNIDAPDTDITGSITVLPESFLDVAALLRQRCGAARAGGNANSLVVAGRGGLPVDPDDYLPSFGLEGGGAGRPGASGADIENRRGGILAMLGPECIQFR